jgi:hypothetical protein
MALCVSDILLHVIAHGLRVNPLPPIRWVADAVLILRGGGVDWDRFLALAAVLRCRLVMERALKYLADTHQVDVPLKVQVALREPHDWLEHIEYRYARVKVYPMSLFLGRYVRLNSGSNILQLLAGLPAFLQRVWDEPTLAATARTFCVKCGRAAKRVISKNMKGAGG